jgi:hypothetical protein
VASRALVIETVLVVVAAACGRIGFDADGWGDGEPVVPAIVPAFSGGSRIKAQIADYGGGARDVIGWHDAQLDLPCSPILAGDGSRRCLPRAASIAYADATCSTRVGRWSNLEDPPRWAFEDEADTCELRRHLYRLGDELALQMYYSRSGETCSGPFALPSTSRLFAVGLEEPPDTFALLADTMRGTGRLRAAGWQSADGASYLTELFDSMLGTSCVPSEGMDGMRCLPSGTQPSASLFADAACTTQLAPVAGPCAASPYVVVGEPCEPARIHERGAAWTGPVFERSGETCQPSSGQTDLTVVGPELPVTTFVSGVASRGDQTGRIVASDWLALDGARRRLHWRDTLRADENCGTASGGLFPEPRCIPADLVASTGDFRDSACSLPIANPAYACSPSYIFVADTRGITIHAIDRTAPPPTTRFIYGSTCAQFALEPVDYLVGGPAIPVSMFAVATVYLE